MEPKTSQFLFQVLCYNENHSQAKFRQGSVFCLTHPKESPQEADKGRYVILSSTAKGEFPKGPEQNILCKSQTQ